MLEQPGEMKLGEADGFRDLFQVQIFHIMGINVIDQIVELLYIFLPLVKLDVREQLRLIQMMIPQLHKELDQQGIDGQLHEFAPAEVFVRHLNQKLIQFFVDLREGILRNIEGLGQYGLNAREPLEPGNDRQIEQKDKAAAAWRSIQLMQFAGRDDHDIAWFNMVNDRIDFGIIAILQGYNNFQSSMPVRIIAVRLNIVPDTQRGIIIKGYKFMRIMHIPESDIVTVN